MKRKRRERERGKGREGREGVGKQLKEIMRLVQVHHLARTKASAQVFQIQLQ